MKRRFTILTAALALLAFLAIPMGMWGQTRAEEVYSTCLFGSSYNSQSVSSYTATWTATNNNFTWTIVNGNNNNNGWSYVKFGRKNNASVGSITTQAVYTSAVTKVDLTIDAITANSINSIKLYTSTNNTTWTEAGSFDKSTGKKTVSLANPTANLYYKVEFDCASGSANGLVQVSKVEYYYNTDGNPTCATPTFSPAAGTYTEAQTVSISCATEGATIYYSTDDTEPTTSSSTYSAPIVVSSNMTIKALATATGYDNSAVATAEYTIITLDHAGTLEDPYTVADARAAIDANAGTQGVYATGIVCRGSNNLYNGKYLSYYISEDGTTEANQLEAYNGLGLNGDDFTSVYDVQVGDIVVIYGNLTKYNTTYEFAADNYLVSLVRPQIPSITVNPDVVNAPYAGAEGTLALAYENIEDFISFDYYFCDANGGELEGNDPDWIYAEINEENDTYTLSYIIDANDGAARTAYMKVYTFDDELEEVYAIVTVSQAAYEAPHVTWDLSIASYASASEEQVTWTSDYATMVVDKANAGTNANNYLGGNQSSTRFYKNSELTLSPADGYAITSVVFVATTENYASALQNSTWTNATASLDGTTVTVTPTDGTSDMVAVISNTCGFTSVTVYYVVNNTPFITVSPALVEVDANEHDGTLNLTYENLDITGMSDFDIQFFDENDNAIAGPDWMEVLVAEQDPTIGEGYVVSYLIFENEDEEAHIAYFKVWTYDEEFNEVYSNLVTVNQAAPVAPVTGEYVKVTSAADLTSGQYLIVYEEGSVAFDGSLETLDAANNTIEVVLNNSTIAVDNTTVASEFTIDMTEGTVKSASGYYIGQSSDANGIQTSMETAYTNTISFDNDEAIIVSSGGAHLRYNATSGQERFRYYKSSSYTGQKAIQLYKKVGDEPSTETYTLTINGYTDDNSKTGYYLIASPVTVDPATVAGMTTGDFDLYYFDQNADKEWINYKPGDNSSNPGFNLVPGTGYLYAKKATTETPTYSFELTGTPYDGTGEIEISSGWTLLGNPFGVKAEISEDYFALTPDVTELIPTLASNNVAAMQGVFVYSEEGGSVVFMEAEDGMSNNSSNLVLNLTRNDRSASLVDRAIVRFGEGQQLPKFQLNPESTKLYIAQGDKDYAIVRSEGQGEMPVNFKAAENGTYTLSMNVENIDMNYLHLIDNMTGMDIDLLQTPSYTFEANTNDYANRFKLVFAANGTDEVDEASFAFFSDGNLIVNNEGNATLQVIDVNGRILSSETISGSCSKAINATTGVYMLRLINGDNVKVQKVVVR